MAKKKTAYTRERNRIMNYIRSLKRKGFTSDLYFPTEKQIRAEGVKGKELSALTRELKYWTSKKLKEYIENESKSTEKEDFVPSYNVSEDSDFFDRTVMSQWFGILNTCTNGEAYDLLKWWMYTVIQTQGVHDTAIMLQEGAQAGHLLTWEIVYKADYARSYIGYMIDFLPEAGVMFKEELLDKMEYMKRLEDAFELDEDWEQPT